MAHVKHLSTDDLITRMERASTDQNLDDETFELEQRLSALGETFRWLSDYVIAIEPKEF